MPIKQIPAKRGGRSAYAQVSVLNPGKGLNTLISDTLINDQEASDLENIKFVESGCPSKADGFSQAGNTLDNNPRGLGFYTDTSLNKYLLTVDGTGLKYLNSNTWTSISGASFSSSAQINMTQASGKMYIWDASNGGAELSSLTLTRPGSMPKASFSIYYNGYHIASGVTTQENRIYISTTSDSSDFTNSATTLNNSTEVPGATVFAGSGAQYVDVNKNDGDKITGLAKFQDVLVIFKERSIYQMTFDSTGVPILQAVSKNYGAVSHRAIENVDNDVFFLSRNGVYVLGNEPNYLNVIRTNELTARINPLIKTINQNAFTSATAIFQNYTYYLGIPTGASTTNDVTITYDRRFLAFSRWTHVLPECFSVYTDTDNQEYIYFTSANSAKVYKIDPEVYLADGEAISSSWTSKNMDLSKFGQYKRWIDCTILFRQFSGTITIEVLTDNGDVVKTSTISSVSGNGIGAWMWGEMFFGGSDEEADVPEAAATNNVPYRLRVGKKARSIQLRISNDNENERFTLLGFNFTYRDYSHFTWPSALKVQ